MKEDIKKLYKKDPKLAIKAAKALGFQIKIKADSKLANQIKAKMKAIDKKLDDLVKYVRGTPIAGYYDPDRGIKKVKSDLSDIKIALISEAERV